MDVSVIIVNWNTKELICECVKSIEQYTKDISYEVIVVDNASNDGSVEALKNLNISSLKIVESKENLGFSKANNLGLKYSKGEYIIFLNPDTELISDLLNELKDSYDEHKNDNDFILAPQLLNADKTLQRSGFTFPVLNLDCLGKYIRNKFLNRNLKNGSGFVQADWVRGACILLKRNVIDKHGAWNEDFFLYGEDLEISYRYYLEGLYTYIDNSIKVVHLYNQSGIKAFSNKESYYKKMSGLITFYGIYFSNKKLINLLSFKVLSLYFRLTWDFRNKHIIKNHIRFDKDFIEQLKQG